MAYSINSNNNSYQPSMGQISVDKEKLKNDIKTNSAPVTNTLDHKDNGKKIATVASWAGISLAMDQFNAKCRTVNVNGKQTSLLHKVQYGADKIGHAVEDSKVGTKIFSALDKTKDWTKAHIIDKNKVLSAIANTSAKPEWSSPKMMLNGTIAETAQDAVEAIQKYCANKNVNIETLGITEKQFEKICKEPGKYVGNLIKICKKMPEEAVEVGSQMPLLKTLLRRRVYPSELVNKMTVLGKKSIIGETKNLSKLGKTVPKEFLRIIEGLTNGTAGGKIAIFMQAMCYGDAFMRAAKAPKGEKIKTFAEAVVNDLSFYVLMPLGLSTIYRSCGTKYIGMSKSQVTEFRKRLATLNKNVADKTISKSDYKAEVKALKEMLKGDTKVLKTDKFAVKMQKHITNIVNKPVKTVGKVLSTGLEKISPYAGKDASILDMVKALPQKTVQTISKLIGKIFKSKGDGIKGFTVKGTTGAIIRFSLYMFAIAPFLAKIATKGFHMIFGRPSYSVLDDEEDTQKSVKNSTEHNIVTKTSQPQTVQQVNTVIKEEQPFVRQNLLDKYKNYQPQTKQEVKQEEENQKQSAAVATAVAAKRYIPSTEAVKVPNTNRYIPSTNAVEADYSEALAKLQKALKTSMSYEKMARVQASAKP